MGLLQVRWIQIKLHMFIIFGLLKSYQGNVYRHVRGASTLSNYTVSDKKICKGRVSQIAL